MSAILDAFSAGFDVHDITQTLVFSFVIGSVYYLFERNLETTKQKAWIVMLISSAVLSCFGTYYVARAQLYQQWSAEYVYVEDSISRSVMLFFLASNIMDLVLGTIHYPKYLDPFSTIAHHIFYISFILILLANHYSRGFILCFFMEIPTFILAIGTVWTKYRSDLLFGVSFLLTRIFYNLFLALVLMGHSFEGLIWKTCFCVLGLHLFWFSKWVKVYGTKIWKGNSNDVIGMKTTASQC